MPGTTEEALEADFSQILLYSGSQDSREPSTSPESQLILSQGRPLSSLIRKIFKNTDDLHDVSSPTPMGTFPNLTIPNGAKSFPIVRPVNEYSSL